MTLLKIHSTTICKIFKKRRIENLLINLEEVMDSSEFINSLNQRILIEKVLKVDNKNYNKFYPLIVKHSKSLKNETKKSLKKINYLKRNIVYEESMLIDEVFEMNKCDFLSIGEDILKSLII